MAHSELQRKYTLEDALCTLRSACAYGESQGDPALSARLDAAEQWIKLHVAQLMAVGLVKRIEAFEFRPDDMIVVTTHDLDMSMQEWMWLRDQVTNQVRAHLGPDTKVMVVDGVEFSVLRKTEMSEPLDVQRVAPDHVSGGRAPIDGELTCNRQNLVTPTRPFPTCACQAGHDGPHMDRTAIAHAGKAGEVWE